MQQHHAYVGTWPMADNEGKVIWKIMLEQMITTQKINKKLNPYVR